ncbi:SMI1/KNR4 family protein [Chryseobacterium nepalense]|uniref:SMI1/KNR4 family protein n=1 Tax=Chryseobacterium nepalense TaxID=1854498 RepID=UPI002E00C335|nr:hypothetical protein [Chryseobacterium nepalense]
MKLELLKKNFVENSVNVTPSNIEEIKIFQKKYNVEVPKDLQDYYLEINGSGNETLNNLYEFYSIHRTKKIHEELINWKGIPDYSKLNFTGMENVFVFGAYEFNLYAFGIKLHQNLSFETSVFILCGENFRLIANNFTEFVDLYLNRPEEIYI